MLFIYYSSSVSHVEWPGIASSVGDPGPGGQRDREYGSMTDLLGAELGGSSQLGPRPLRPELWGPIPVETTLANLSRQPAGPAEEAPAPVTFTVLATAAGGMCCDVEWIAPEGAVLRAGDLLARLYEVGSGMPREEFAVVPLRVDRHLLRRNDKAVDGSAICKVTALGISVG
jgi:hypothetical protein